MKNSNKSAFDWQGTTAISNVLYGDDAPLERRLSDGSRDSTVLTMPAAVGQGFLELIRLSESASVFISNAQWHNETVVEVLDGPYVRLNFSLEQNMTMAFGDSGRHGVLTPSWRIINNTVNDVVLETMSPGSRNVWVTIAFKPEFLHNSFCDEAFLDDPILDALFSRPEERAIYHEYPLDYRLNQIVGNIIASNLDDRFHLAYIHSKAIELLCIAIDQILRQKDEEIIPVRLRERDKRAIELAKQLVDENLEDPLDLRELCSVIGINRNKLHYGFKHLFNMPISKYIQEVRLMEAYRLLEAGKLPVIEVANRVGFTHQSSFSTAFKKRFGHPPSLVKSEQ